MKMNGHENGESNGVSDILTAVRHMHLELLEVLADLQKINASRNELILDSLRFTRDRVIDVERALFDRTKSTDPDATLGAPAQRFTSDGLPSDAERAERNNGGGFGVRAAATEAGDP